MRLPDAINLQFMTIDDVHLLENIVDVPYFNGTVNGRRDRTIPIADRKCLQLNNATEVRIEHLQ